MIVKLLIFLCSLCVVKAFVVVNIFDDDVNETQRSSLSHGMKGSPKISDCSPLGCVQLCRRLGLKGGVCVIGKCKCDWTYYTQTGDVDDTQRSSLLDGIEGSPKITDCSPLGCVQLCRRLGLKGGVCVNGKCKCDLYKELGDVDETQRSPLVDGIKGSPKISDCSPLGCIQLCRRLGLKGGVCVNGKCKCDLYKELGDVDENQMFSLSVGMEGSSEISDCSALDCTQLCRHLGLKGGACVNGKCICDLFVELEDDTPRSLTMCDWSSCDRGCRSIGYPGGSCMGSECRCNPQPFKFEVTNQIESTDGEVQEKNEIPVAEEENKLYKDFTTEIKQKTSIGTCNVFNCNTMCRRIGFIGGRCDSIKNTCQCF